MTRIRPYVALALFMIMLVGSSSTTTAQETHFFGICQAWELTTAAKRPERGGQEFSNGGWVPFRKWHNSDRTDMRFEMLTQVSGNFGILWGASAGSTRKSSESNRVCIRGLTFSAVRHTEISGARRTEPADARSFIRNSLLKALRQGQTTPVQKADEPVKIGISTEAEKLPKLRNR